MRMGGLYSGKESFVQYEESFVQYKESFVQYEESFVQYKESFVQHEECFVWPLWATVGSRFKSSMLIEVLQKQVLHRGGIPHLPKNEFRSPTTDSFSTCFHLFFAPSASHLLWLRCCVRNFVGRRGANSREETEGTRGRLLTFWRENCKSKKEAKSVIDVKTWRLIRYDSVMYSANVILVKAWLFMI